MNNPFTCQSCRSPLMQSLNGSLCPNGCGKLMPKMPQKAMRINHALIAGVQHAQQMPGGVYQFGDSQRFWERIPGERPIAAIVNELPRLPDGERLGIVDGDKVVKLRIKCAK